MHTPHTFLTTVLITFSFTLFLCSPANNPYTDENNAEISIRSADGSLPVYAPVGDSIALRVILTLPGLIESVQIFYGSAEEGRDTLVPVAGAEKETLTVRHAFLSEHDAVVTATAIMASGNEKSDTIVVDAGVRATVGNNGVLNASATPTKAQPFFLVCPTTGTSPVSYIWYFNGTVMNSETNDTLAFQSLLEGDTGAYICQVTNSWGVDTSAAFNLSFTSSSGTEPTITVTSPYLTGDSAVIAPTLLGIAGTVTVPTGIASLSIAVNDSAVAVVGTSNWTFSLDELITGSWNNVLISATGNDSTIGQKTIFLYLKPTLSAMAAPRKVDSTCTTARLSWSPVEHCDHYLLYRSVVGGQTTVSHGTGDTTVIDTGLTSSTHYAYSVQAWYTVPGIPSISDTTPVSPPCTVQTFACFQRDFGGTVNEDGVGIVAINDTSWVSTGTSTSFSGGPGDIYLVRGNTVGDTAWTKTYGPSNDYQAVSARAGTTDELVVGAGYTCASCGMMDLAYPSTFVASTGTHNTWTATNMDRMHSCPSLDAMRTSDGGLIFVGENAPPDNMLATGGNSAGYAFKLDASGDSLWQKWIAFDGYSSGAVSICEASSGGFLVAGWRSSPIGFTGGIAPPPKAMVTKLSASGDSLWSNSYGNTTDYNRSSRIRTVSDGGFILVGQTAVAGADTNILVVKMTNQGVAQWTTIIGGNATDYSTDVIETTDGGFAVCGATDIGNGDFNAYLAKLDMYGTLEWEADYGGTGEEKAGGVAQMGDGGFVITGSTTSYGTAQKQMYVVKTDTKGNTIPYVE